MKTILFVIVLFILTQWVGASDPIDNWAEYPLPASAGAPVSIAFGNRAFVAGGNGSIITSTNGADWTLAANSTASYVQFVIGRFLTTTSFSTSTNGLDWSPLPSPATVQCVTFANGLYYAIVGSVINLA